MTQEKKNAGYEGEADQHKNCRKKFSNAHIMRNGYTYTCLLYTSPSPRDRTRSRMPSSA